jgi:hypothetical protein
MQRTLVHLGQVCLALMLELSREAVQRRRE